MIRISNPVQSVSTIGFKLTSSKLIKIEKKSHGWSFKDTGKKFNLAVPDSPFLSYSIHMGKSFENDRPFRPMYNEDFGFEDCSALRVGKYGLEKLFMDQKVLD